jgi:hypothetical protein
MLFWTYPSPGTLDISFTRLPLDIIKQIGKPNNFKVFELGARKTKG